MPASPTSPSGRSMTLSHGTCPVPLLLSGSRSSCGCSTGGLGPGQLGAGGGAGPVGFGPAQLGPVVPSWGPLVLLSPVRLSSAQLNPAQLSAAQRSLVQLSPVLLSLARFGSAQPALAQLTQFGSVQVVPARRAAGAAVPEERGGSVPFIAPGRALRQR